MSPLSAARHLHFFDIHRSLLCGEASELPLLAFLAHVGSLWPAAVCQRLLLVGRMPPCVSCVTTPGLPGVAAAGACRGLPLVLDTALQLVLETDLRGRPPPLQVDVVLNFFTGVAVPGEDRVVYDLRFIA